MKYHHLGIPTKEKKAGMRYLAHLKMSVGGYEESPYNVEWMLFDDDCPLPELLMLRILLKNTCFRNALLEWRASFLCAPYGRGR